MACMPVREDNGVNFSGLRFLFLHTPTKTHLRNQLPLTLISDSLASLPLKFNAEKLAFIGSTCSCMPGQGGGAGLLKRGKGFLGGDGAGG